MNNELLKDRENYSQFVDDAPTINLPEISVDVDVASLDELKDSLEKQVHVLQNKIRKS